jgi:hypothetical protein
VTAIGPNPRCVARSGEVEGITVEWCAGRGVTPADIASVVRFRRFLTVVDPARPKQLQPDGTLICVPDTTKPKSTIKTKSRLNGVRG